MLILEYRKKPLSLILSGIALGLLGAFLLLMSTNCFFSSGCMIETFIPAESKILFILTLLLTGLLFLAIGLHLVFTRRKVLIDKQTKMVITREVWFGGLKERTTQEFPFHSFRSVSVGGIKKLKKNSYFYPVLLGIEDIVIPCGSKSKKDVGSEIKKISSLMNLQLEKKYNRVSKLIAFKG